MVELKNTWTIFPKHMPGGRYPGLGVRVLRKNGSVSNVYASPRMSITPIGIYWAVILFDGPSLTMAEKSAVSNYAAQLCVTGEYVI